MIAAPDLVGADHRAMAAWITLEAHDARVSELLAANNALLARARGAELTLLQARLLTARPFPTGACADMVDIRFYANELRQLGADLQRPQLATSGDALDLLADRLDAVWHYLEPQGQTDAP